MYVFTYCIWVHNNFVFRAFPEPVTSWVKNGEELDPASSKRIRQTDTGNLVIRDVEKSDAGEYFCQARNMVGTRSSDVARLSVHVKPAFIEDPEDVTAREGDDVSLHCKVAHLTYSLTYNIYFLTLLQYPLKGWWRAKASSELDKGGRKGVDEDDQRRREGGAAYHQEGRAG